MKIPKPKFQVGDSVLVRCDEAGCPPLFDAVVSAIVFDPKTQQLGYTVMEKSGQLTDGYTEDWLETPPAEVHQGSFGVIPQGKVRMLTGSQSTESRREFFHPTEKKNAGKVAPERGRVGWGGGAEFEV